MLQRLKRTACLPACLQGLQHVRAEGEAEATCAVLNRLDLVDACCSKDVDSLLFGAQLVIKTVTVMVGCGGGGGQAQGGLAF